ncbi:MAG: phage major capsid protein [Actinomycetota bacterium]|jgi:HK97 family phage major capsid protein
MTLEDLTAALRELLASIDAEGRDMTDEEAERAADLTSKIEAAQAKAEIRSKAAGLVTVTNKVVPVSFAAPKSDDTLERAFEHYMRTGQANSDLVELRAQGKGTDSAGGYLVPPGFRQKLVERLKAFGGIAAEAEEIRTDNGETVEYPTVDDTANSGEIVAEHGTFAAGADVTFGTKSLPTYKYMAGGASNLPIKVSVELLQDSAFDVESFLVKALATRIHRAQSAHWATGTGTGQPEGLFVGGSSGLTLASASTVTHDELVSIVHNVDPEYRNLGNCKWVMNDATLEVIRKLKDSDGRPLYWNGSNDMGSELKGTLLGYPVVIDQGAPTFAVNAEVLAFGDIREGYVIRRVNDIQIVVLNELYAPNGQVGFMAWTRAGGHVQNANAFTLASAAAA